MDKSVLHVLKATLTCSRLTSRVVWPVTVAVSRPGVLDRHTTVIW